MTTTKGPDQVPLPQAILGPLTRAAIFLVVTIKPEPECYAAVRSFCGDLPGLIRAVEFRDIDAGLTCIVGFGSNAWDRLFGSPRPAELHPFREFRSGNRHAIATPGDVLFHIRAGRLDLCFELATQIMESIGDAVEVADEVHGFRYFDDRDLIGFVDGTENPRGKPLMRPRSSVTRTSAFAGGSYVIVQKYLHDMKAWNALSVETQERIIGRKKLSDIEFKDSDKAPTHTTSSRPSTRTARRSKFCATTCPSVVRATASSAPTSSATAGHPASRKRCSRICSLAIRLANTTASSTSAGQ